MMNDDTLRNIEYLREKADVTYEEAFNLLTKFDGNVMRVLVELERQGRVYPTGGYGRPDAQQADKCAEKEQKAKANKKKVSEVIGDALSHRLVVETGTGENKKTIANLSAPYAVGASILAPYVSIPTVALMFVLGHRVRIEKDKPVKMPENVETFVDNAVSNIKKTATSVADAFHTEVKPTKPADQSKRDDDDDEGGEITIE